MQDQVFEFQIITFPSLKSQILKGRALWRPLQSKYTSLELFFL